MLAGFGASLLNEAAGFGAVVRVFCLQHRAERVGLGLTLFEFITSLNVCVFWVRHWVAFANLLKMQESELKHHGQYELTE